MTFREMMNSGGRVWLLLVTLSILSFLVGEDFGIRGHWEIIILMVIAFVKARMIVQHFMEVNHAPLPLRIAFDVWNVLGPAALIGVVLLGEQGMLS